MKMPSWLAELHPEPGSRSSSVSPQRRRCQPAIDIETLLRGWLLSPGKQDDNLARKLVWRLRIDGESKSGAYRIWLAILGKSATGVDAKGNKREPWTRADFNEKWSRADEKITKSEQLREQARRELEGLDDVQLNRRGNNGRNLPGEFWEYMPELEHIRQAAYSRGRSADSVLGVVLARMSAFAPVDLALDAGLGLTPITLFCALCGPPESGKSVSIRVGLDLMPEGQFQLGCAPQGTLVIFRSGSMERVFLRRITRDASRNRQCWWRRQGQYGGRYKATARSSLRMKAARDWSQDQCLRAANIIAETIRSAGSGNRIADKEQRASEGDDQEGEPW